MGGHIGAAKLWYDQPHKQFYLLVSLEIAVPDPVPESHQHIVGVDVGQRYLAVATDTLNQTHFFSGREARAKTDHSARLRKRLQHKGTRSATRLLTVIARRERRLKQDRNHLISRQLVDAYPHSLIGLEDLTHIRERTNRTHRHGKKATVKQRRANRHASQWAFAELQGYVASKALLAGSMAVKVDAYKTSQACPRCGYTAEDNRPEKGLLFSCQVCQLVLHADLIGARNVALRTLLARQDWVRTGVLSERREVSDDEAKAMQRRRYAELRWSPDTNPALEPGVSDWYTCWERQSCGPRSVGCVVYCGATGCHTTQGALYAHLIALVGYARPSGAHRRHVAYGGYAGCHRQFDDLGHCRQLYDPSEDQGCPRRPVRPRPASAPSTPSRCRPLPAPNREPAAWGRCVWPLIASYGAS
jgi:IS605 OrfB family transposase